MNIQQLEYIIAVDSLGSFSKAAEQQFVTQATLSAMVKKLETELDIIIFDRSINPVITTDQGKDVVAQARVIIAGVNELKDTSNRINDKIEGKIRIGIIPTIASTLLPKILLPLVEKYPDLHLDISEITTENIVASLKNGDLDAGIMATPWEDDKIEEEILYYEAMLAYGVEDEKIKYLHTKALNDKKIWLLEEGHCFREQTINLCNLQEKDNIPLNFKFEANSFETLISITDTMGGITLLPELYYLSMSKAFQKKTKGFKSPVPVREVSVVYFRPYAKKRIIDRLAEEIRAIIKPILSTSKMKASEQNIIGI
jgi:LysR family hydrogen peroxide-inducible transcriptional activator